MKKILQQFGDVIVMILLANIYFMLSQPRFQYIVLLVLDRTAAVALRTLLGILILYVFTGYSLIAIIFPSHAPPVYERLMLSIGASIAITTALSILLNAWQVITTTTLQNTVLLVLLGLSAGAVYRRVRLPDDRRFQLFTGILGTRNREVYPRA